MKPYQFLTLAVCLTVFGCSVKQQSDYIEQQKRLPALTKAIINRGETDEFAINDVDLANLVRFRILENKSKGRELVLSEVIPLLWEDEPCLFVLQFNEGFEVISADKRSPVPIASNSSASFRECNDPEGFGGHLNLVAEEIWFLKHGYLTNPTPEGEEYIQSSIDFWKMVNSDSTFIQAHSTKTKGHVLPEPDPLPIGHWEVTGVSTEEIVYDSIPHLTSTTWHQDFPYNDYCPDDKDTVNMIWVCPAGCVAIAGAQMLYFLHFKDGVPVNSPSQGICTGHVYDNTVYQNFWGPTDTLWTYMSHLAWFSDIPAALLIGDLGKRLHMDYHWDGSRADTEDLVDDVFSPYGWSCIFVDHYDSGIILSSLTNGYPVICAGRRLPDKGVGKIGHAFLVDRYKRYRTKTTTTYEWVSDDPDPQASTYLLPPYDEITYSSPHISYYGMNWGQGGYGDDGWCSMAGIWQYRNKPPYSYNRRMIHSFSIINDQ